ncbi:IS66 family transposase, partial [Brevibacillus borstelensis]|uniref:IS66 family transposase n=1 Tax=Brevibacillus borstelensis TaxID=45462 RepID=UPI002E23D144|nr:transposase [Brevibacillus borstelensis]
LNRAFKDRDHEKVTHPTGGLIFAMVVNFLMSTVVNILVDIHKVLPKSKLSEALTYALNHKEEFMNYLKDGNCSISNNLAENSIRPFTIGRRNWLFSGSPKGASASAAVYSIIESAKANGLNPYKYLYFIFKNLPGVQFGQHPEFLEDYLPWSPDALENCKE